MRPWSLLSELKFACPICGDLLVSSEEDAFFCDRDQHVFSRIDGVWRFMRPEREKYYQKFVQEYETIRWLEQRGSTEAQYYRSLPYLDESLPLSGEWVIRAKSFEVLMQDVLIPMENTRDRTLKILDLGAGNCWLANRLALRGHGLVAVDLTINSFDGLGAYCYYQAQFVPVQSEFLHLPFHDDQFDLAIFNASFHYAENYEATLREALRMLAPQGKVVIMDSPVYRDATSGRQMTHERENDFEKKYGFPSNSLESENFLTYKRLEQLSKELLINWQLIKPFYGLRWEIRPLKSRLLGRREPAKFILIVGGRVH